MRYPEALKWLYGLSARGVRLELDRVQAACALRSHPHRNLPAVHVAGTNGKGSVCAFTESALRAAGFRTGHFCSPHLHRFVERVRIGGQPLSEDEVAERLTEIRAAMSSLPPLTFFEVTTLMAFEAFRDHQCDIAVLEVGLGGRLDATNVVEDRRVSVVTRIARDHTRILGDTLGKIAREKGGILRPGAPAVLGVVDPEARRELERMCVDQDIDRWWCGEHFEGTAPPDVSSMISRVALDTPQRATIRVGARTSEYVLGLLGDHQVENAAMACAALARLGARGFIVPEAAVERGLACARWPGRLELLRDGARHVVVDCAHNPDGCQALATFLRSRALPRPVVLLFGAMQDKEHEAMLAPFDGLIDARIYAVPEVHRAPPSAEVFAAIRPGLGAPTVGQGLEAARAAAGDNGLIVVAGSIFLVNEVRASLLGVRSDPPIAM